MFTDGIEKTAILSRIAPMMPRIERGVNRVGRSIMSGIRGFFGGGGKGEIVDNIAENQRPISQAFAGKGGGGATLDAGPALPTAGSPSGPVAAMGFNPRNPG